MQEFADLEVSINQWESGYSVELRFSNTHSDDTRIIQSTQVLFQEDTLTALRMAQLDAATYGKLLSDQLFADEAIKTGFAQIVAATQAQNQIIRLRLLIAPSATSLHHIRWETMIDPTTQQLLLTSEQMLFSRYLGSYDWRPIRLRPRSALKALAVVASPSNVAQYAPGGNQLKPLDKEGEMATIRESLGTIPLTTIPSDTPTTLNTILHHLNEGYDILYLVAHGAFVRGKPYVWLEADDGSAAVTEGDELVNHIQTLRQRPRIIVLASCESAGTGDSVQTDGAAKTSLGPRLAASGIPAVIAMQGSITITTASVFMKTFFAALEQTGFVDHAMAIARREVRQNYDWWMPVLFMRLKSGRIWYVPGFGDEGKSFEKWPAIVRSIQRGACTPIIGPHLTQSLLEAPHEIAQKWAERFHFPMSIEHKDNLPQVAQYLAINQDHNFPRDELIDYLRHELLTRYDAILGEKHKKSDLATLFREVGLNRIRQDPHEPFKVLAELPFPIYITTNVSNLLDESLIAAGKTPHIEMCRWNEDLEHLPSIYDDNPDFRPSVDDPLIYHLFGRCTEPETMVITEDDYFDYLIGITNNKQEIPSVIRRALADTALLFLGFQMNEWNFRILFRSIMNQEGRRRRRRYAHVAAQIDPEDSQIIDPERARTYLETYFGDSDISIFWGTVEDFIKDLMHNYNA